MIFSPEVKTLDKGHGRSEIRRLRSSDKLKGYVEFPHVERVFRIDRERTINKRSHKYYSVSKRKRIKPCKDIRDAGDYIGRLCARKN